MSLKRQVFLSQCLWPFAEAYLGWTVPSCCRGKRSWLLHAPGKMKFIEYLVFTLLTVSALSKTLPSPHPNSSAANSEDARKARILSERLKHLTSTISSARFSSYTDFLHFLNKGKTLPFVKDKKCVIVHSLPNSGSKLTHRIFHENGFFIHSKLKNEQVPPGKPVYLKTHYPARSSYRSTVVKHLKHYGPCVQLLLLRNFNDLLVANKRYYNQRNQVATLSDAIASTVSYCTYWIAHKEDFMYALSYEDLFDQSVLSALGVTSSNQEPMHSHPKMFAEVEQALLQLLQNVINHSEVFGRITESSNDKRVNLYHGAWENSVILDGCVPRVFVSRWCTLLVCAVDRPILNNNYTSNHGMPAKLINANDEKFVSRSTLSEQTL